LVDLAGELYDAALRPVLWPMVLQRAANRFRAQFGILIAVDLATGRPRVLEATPVDERERLALFGTKHVMNPWTRAALADPFGIMARTSELVPEQELLASEFYADCLQPLGLFHAMGANLFGDEGLYGALCFMRTRRDGPFADAELAQMQPLVKHFERALRVQCRLADADLEREAALESIARLGVGTVFVNARGKVVFCNRKAEVALEQNDGLSVARQRLVAGVSDDTRALRCAIADAALAGAQHRELAGRALTLPRPSGQPPWRVLVSPLCDGKLGVGLSQPVAVVFITDPAATQLPSAALIAQSFGLTPAESKVAALLARGIGIPEAAKNLGVSINTVRSHVAHVFEKTGTERQAELVALLLSALPVRSDPRASAN
jgi:DNA-binding CsgD family transcriptional regulator